MSMTRIMVAALAAIGLSMAGDGASAAEESATESASVKPAVEVNPNSTFTLVRHPDRAPGPNTRNPVPAGLHVVDPALGAPRIGGHASRRGIAGPYGGPGVRGPYGGARVAGPYGGAGARGPYGGGPRMVRGPYGDPRTAGPVTLCPSRHAWPLWRWSSGWALWRRARGWCRISSSPYGRRLWRCSDGWPGRSLRLSHGWTRLRLRRSLRLSNGWTGLWLRRSPDGWPGRSLRLSHGWTGLWLWRSPDGWSRLRRPAHE